jgi:large subunit ribosomal protein L30
MSAAKSAASTTLHVRQVRSGIGYDKTQKATLKALGLGCVGRTREVPDNPSIRGMVAKIPHLVVIVDDGDGAAKRG